MQYSRLLARLCVCAIILLGVRAQHQHQNPEPPHYKYSREANEQADPHAHAHSHDQHDHGHSHDQHDHGHSHDHHDHDHAHSHDHHGHDHAHADDHNQQHDHGHSHTGQQSQAKQNMADTSEAYDPQGMFAFLNDLKTRRWVYGIGSTLLISVAPFLILSFIPVQANTVENEPMLKILLSFGSGGLLGDAFLHLIPHSQAMHPTTHSHAHSHHGTGGGGGGHSHGPHDMALGGYVLAGIITFLIVEKFVRIMRTKQVLHSHSHSHSHGKKDEEKVKKRKQKDKQSDASTADESDASGDSKKRSLEKKLEAEVGFRVAAYLNMVADFTHNFTDGLAIGASFLAGTNVGLITMVTILVHEVPHEIGDFAILVQSGFTKKKAMFVQLLTALGALSGCILSLSTASDLADAAASSWILPFSAGGFIYIATVSVIPELLENSSMWQSIKEVSALLFGILLMYLIALFE